MENEIILNGKTYLLKETIKNSNSGNWNSGDRNSGNWNSGDLNSGNWNSGDSNSGNLNSGDSNSGKSNSGCMNSGDRNSGCMNSGCMNSGDWNSGDWNSGFLNTNKPKIRIFNKETDVKLKDIKFPNYFYFDLNAWVDVDSMTDKEKEKYYWYKTTEGYLRKIEYKEAWKLSFEQASIEDVKKTLELPNFNHDIFEEISDISKQDFDKKLKPINLIHENKCAFCNKLAQYYRHKENDYVCKEHLFKNK